MSSTRQRLRLPTDWLLASPLAAYVDAFTRYLCERHHASKTFPKYLGCLAHFGPWMSQCQLNIECIDEELVRRFLDDHLPQCDCARPVCRNRVELRAALGHLLLVLRTEAVHLRQADVDLQAGLLTARQTKFDKSRYVPLHPSTTQALRRYQALRNLYLTAKEDTPFFVGTRGRRLGCQLSLRQVDRVFQQLREQLGWVNRGSHAAVRVHDLRHAFIVRRLFRWHDQGVDIDQAMLALSTYVGHARVTNTYWYLSGVPELMGLAAERFAPPVQNTEVDHV